MSNNNNASDKKEWIKNVILFVDFLQFKIIA